VVHLQEQGYAFGQQADRLPGTPVRPAAAKIRWRALPYPAATPDASNLLASGPTPASGRELSRGPSMTASRLLVRADIQKQLFAHRGLASRAGCASGARGQRRVVSRALTFDDADQSK
jgi:hypothetical protein